MAAKTLSLLQKLTKSRSKPDLREDVMAVTQDTPGKKDKAARAAGKEKRRERKAQKQAKRDASQKESGKPSRLCSLSTVEVRRGSEGFVVAIWGPSGSRTFTIAPDQTNQVLRDLETAIVVIRGQL